MDWAAAQTPTKIETEILIIDTLIIKKEPMWNEHFFSEKCIDLGMLMCFSELKLWGSQMTVNWEWTLKGHCTAEGMITTYDWLDQPRHESAAVGL